jgi:death on curing protein
VTLRYNLPDKTTHAKLAKHMRYLTASEIIYINGTLLNDEKILNGTKQIRDLALLEAAVARPAMSAFGEDAYPSLESKVAALFHSVVRNHPFADGNKRTATTSAIFMFAVNGCRVVWDAEDALTVIVSVAEGKRNAEDLAAWFPIECDGGGWEADADQDTQTIAHIIGAHRWLLTELEGR